MSTRSFWFSLQEIYFFTYICTLQFSFCSCCHFCYQNRFILTVLSTSFHTTSTHLLPFPDSRRISSTVNPPLAPDCTELWCDYHARSLTAFLTLPSVMPPSLSNNNLDVVFLPLTIISGVCWCLWCHLGKHIRISSLSLSTEALP